MEGWKYSDAMISYVSILDKIVSGDELFPETKTPDVLPAIALLSKEDNAVRVPSKLFQRMRRKIKEFLSFTSLQHYGVYSISQL